MWPPEWPPCPPEWPPPCPPPCPPPRANTDVEPKTTTMLMIRATVWIFHIRRLVGFARMYLMAYFLIRRLYMLSANNLIVGKPPALLGDSQCLTFAAVLTFSIATRNDVGSGLRMFFKAFNQLERNVHCRFEVNLTRLRVGPFEGPANDKPPALPEVHDSILRTCPSPVRGGPKPMLET